MSFMHLAIALCASLAVGGCAPRLHPSDAATPPGAPLLNLTDRLIRAGCLDCLLEAGQLPRLSQPSGRGREDLLGSARLEVLIAIRERELGLDDSGHLVRARELLATNARLSESLHQLVNIAELLPTRVDGASLDDATLRRRQAARTGHESYVAFLETEADRDVLSAYLWLSFNCAYSAPDRAKLSAWLAAVPTWRDTPLMVYRAATCGVVDLVALERLLESDLRFGELHYFMALATPPAAEIDLTVPHLDRALAWRSDWSTAVFARANAHFEREAFDEALADFDRLLSLRPNSPDALLGRVRALTHLARYEEALRTSDELLALGQWYIGDARFWRALNELQLGRLEPAWAEIELAAALLVNADVPKLAGIVATRRHELEIARQRFQEAWRRNPRDCETAFHLGNVLSQQRAWTRAAEVYSETIACADADAQRLAEEINGLRTVDASSEYRRREIGRREEQIAAGRQMRAAGWFNTAVGYFNLSRFDDARLAAEQVRDDPVYGRQARALLTRLTRR
jgi:tetratricopeptide (TPR) repeat protein